MKFFGALVTIAAAVSTVSALGLATRQSQCSTQCCAQSGTSADPATSQILLAVNVTVDPSITVGIFCQAIDDDTDFSSCVIPLCCNDTSNAVVSIGCSNLTSAVAIPAAAPAASAVPIDTTTPVDTAGPVDSPTPVDTAGPVDSPTPIDTSATTDSD